MIFVTLGTQDKSFYRLLDEIQSLIDQKVICEKVVVQAGQTKYKSDAMDVFDFVSMDVFEKYISECKFLITHGGVGSIINGLNHGKKVIAVARLAQHLEHENDHQVQIIAEFARKGHILGCMKVEELSDALKQIATFNPTNYSSNNERFCKLIEQLIEK